MDPVGIGFLLSQVLVREVCWIRACGPFGNSLHRTKQGAFYDFSCHEPSNCTFMARSPAAQSAGIYKALFPNFLTDCTTKTIQTRQFKFCSMEDFMKYMIEFTVRTAGLSHDQNFAGSGALLTAFSKWKPEDGLTVHAFVSNLAGNGGYILAEASDPKVIVAFVSKFTFWNDANVVPVVDIGESVPINAASLGWAQSASKS